jgi:hypothetical protein
MNAALCRHRVHAWTFVDYSIEVRAFLPSLSMSGVKEWERSGRASSLACSLELQVGCWMMSTTVWERE